MGRLGHFGQIRLWTSFEFSPASVKRVWDYLVQACSPRVKRTRQAFSYLVQKTLWRYDIVNISNLCTKAVAHKVVLRFGYSKKSYLMITLNSTCKMWRLLLFNKKFFTCLFSIRWFFDSKCAKFKHVRSCAVIGHPGFESRDIWYVRNYTFPENHENGRARSKKSVSVLEPFLRQGKRLKLGKAGFMITWRHLF